MFDIFKNVPDNELYVIYKDILKSEEDGMRPRSLDVYTKYLQEICGYYMISRATEFAKELFFKEIAKRYFEDVKLNI